jgi:hypothetical protein
MSTSGPLAPSSHRTFYYVGSSSSRKDNPKMVAGWIDVALGPEEIP